MVENLTYKLTMFEEVSYHHTPQGVVRKLNNEAPFEIYEKETRLDLMRLKKGESLILADEDVFVTKQTS
jgi:hypothetical protein